MPVPSLNLAVAFITRLTQQLLGCLHCRYDLISYIIAFAARKKSFFFYLFLFSVSSFSSKSFHGNNRVTFNCAHKPTLKSKHRLSIIFWLLLFLAVTTEVLSILWFSTRFPGNDLTFASFSLLTWFSLSWPVLAWLDFEKPIESSARVAFEKETLHSSSIARRQSFQLFKFPFWVIDEETIVSANKVIKMLENRAIIPTSVLSQSYTAKIFVNSMIIFYCANKRNFQSSQSHYTRHSTR